jgi:hypothetical protein
LDSTKFWKPGEFVADDFDIPIPTDVLATLPADHEDFSGPLVVTERYDLDGHTGSPCLSSGPPSGSLFIQMHAVILAR